MQFNSMNDWNLATPQLPETNFSSTFSQGIGDTNGIFGGVDIGGTQATPNSMFSMDSMFGGADGQGGSGWLKGGLDTAAGLVSAWQGLQSLDLAKESFKFNKDATTTNIANQAKTINAEQNDRQKRRLSASGGTGWNSLANYSAKNNVSGKIGG